MGAVAKRLTALARVSVGALAPAPGAPPSPAFPKARKVLDARPAVNALLGLGILGIVSAF